VAGDRPPLIVISHGGPVAAADSTLDYTIQFWTSRGFAVADVNYGGSTGFGRAYRQRLNRQWGVVDVADCIRAAQFLAAEGKADPGRLVIRGGSAGGFTTLAALTAFPDVFKAGASYYGVSDLEALLHDSHKFEARCLDILVGPYPAAKALYEARSPIHAVDRLSCPLILFQGLEDKVVPPNQSEMMVEALRRKGRPWPTWRLPASSTASARPRTSSAASKPSSTSMARSSASSRPIASSRFANPQSAGMTDDDTRRAFVILGAALLVGAAVPAAQNAPRERAPEFEVASVKANESGAGQRSVGFQPGGRFVARNMTLRGLVAAGYGAPQPLPLYRVVGGPGWVDADRFDIDAMAALDPPPQAGWTPRNQQTLRALLTSRFGLKAHSEQQPAAVVRARCDARRRQARPAAQDIARVQRARCAARHAALAVGPAALRRLRLHAARSPHRAASHDGRDGAVSHAQPARSVRC
jgi:dienelactone hydrolase